MFPKIKPGKQPYQVERRKTKDTRDSKEGVEKTKVRKREHYRCRWPDCEYRDVSQPLDVAHPKEGAKGMGGDKTGIRTQADLMMLLCRLHHQGPVSIHSGDLRWVPLTKDGTNGVCAFEIKRGKTWHRIAYETALGVVKWL